MGLDRCEWSTTWKVLVNIYRPECKSPSVSGVIEHLFSSLGALVSYNFGDINLAVTSILVVVVLWCQRWSNCIPFRFHISHKCVLVLSMVGSRDPKHCKINSAQFSDWALPLPGLGSAPVSMDFLQAHCLLLFPNLLEIRPVRSHSKAQLWSISPPQRAI